MQGKARQRKATQGNARQAVQGGGGGIPPGAAINLVRSMYCRAYLHINSTIPNKKENRTTNSPKLEGQALVALT